MPEGDTIHRVATTLRGALLGHTLTRVEIPRHRRPWPTVGATITAVDARGKHLLIGSDDGLTVHTHQRMTGAWHLYRPGERWRKSARAAVVHLVVPGHVAVCFSAPIVEVLPTRALDRHPTLSQLGPDLCEPDPDLDEVLGRLGARSGDRRSIGEALLDQRVSAGIGNVYRCDVLFLHGLHPATPVDDLDLATRRSLFHTAGQLLRGNLATAARTTTGKAPGTLWVHGRGGRPCRRCATPIVVEHLGDQARVVYRCPVCQPWVRAGLGRADGPATQ